MTVLSLPTHKHCETQTYQRMQQIEARRTMEYSGWTLIQKTTGKSIYMMPKLLTMMNKTKSAIISKPSIYQLRESSSIPVQV